MICLCERFNVVLKHCGLCWIGFPTGSACSAINSFIFSVLLRFTFSLGLLCSHSWWVYLPKRCSASYLYVIIPRFMGQSGSKAWLRSSDEHVLQARPPESKEIFSEIVINHTWNRDMQNWIILRTKNVIWPLVEDAGCLCGLSERKIRSRRLQRLERKARKVIILCLHAVRITLCRLFKLPNVVMKKFHYANIFAASCWKIGSHYKKFSYQKAGLE